MKKHHYLKGAAILTAAGLASKLLGAFYRIPFFRVVGPEGMGLYQMAYPIYTMLLAVSSAGIPVAVSKLISESLASRDFPSVKKVFFISLIFIAGFGGLTSLWLYKNAPFIAANILHDTRAVHSIRAIAPAILFVSIMSVFRGYFQGFQEMVPTASSQVLEQFVRVATILFGAYLFLPKGIEYAAAAATFGAVTGAGAGLLFLVGLYVFKPHCEFWQYPLTTFKTRARFSVFQILRMLITLATPISLGVLVVPVMQTIDALTVPGRLQLAGFSISKAAELYGQLTGGAVTLINVPTVLTVSLGTSLVPSISDGLARRSMSEVNRQINSAVSITILVCLPAAVGLAVLATPISSLLFNCPEAGLPLLYLTPATLLLGLHQTTAGILQGMGKTSLPVLNLALGAIIKFLANYHLTAIAHIGIIGAAIGTVGCFLVSSVLNIIFIRILTGWQPGYRKLLLGPVVAVTIMAVVVYYAFEQLRMTLGNSWGTVFSITIGALLYFVVLASLGIFRKADFASFTDLFRRPGWRG